MSNSFITKQCVAIGNHLAAIGCAALGGCFYSHYGINPQVWPCWLFWPLLPCMFLGGALAYRQFSFWLRQQNIESSQVTIDLPDHTRCDRKNAG